METELRHPAKQITEIISRIYNRGLTTTSGGNISILDANGDIWVTPSGVDKGSLRKGDIVLVKADGQLIGKHKPSSEFPFHKAIFDVRKDIRAIIHAHPPALVSFSIVRDFPNPNVIPQAKAICGEIGYASYELPGSQELGESIAAEFQKGHNAVIMENHGTVVGGINLQDAFERFETFEFSARSLINARQLGEARFLTNSQIESFENLYLPLLPEMDETSYPPDELEIRSEICKMVRRACKQGLMISTYGTASVRWRGNDFLITPRDVSRWDLVPRDIVQIKSGHREKGKIHSRSVRLHQRIYEKYPKINSVFITQAPNSMAFAITGQSFDDRTIPESWILLQDIPILPFESHFKGDNYISEILSPKHPVVIIENDSILVTGNSLLHAFDRLEVAEFSARSLIQSKPLGEMVPINTQQIEELRKKFLS
jgi:L-fuculose-phosphate aldolase